MKELNISDLTELGLVYKDSEYLVNVLRLKGFVEKKSFFEIVYCKVVKERRDNLAKEDVYIHQDIYHDCKFNCETIKFLRLMVGIIRFEYIDRPHMNLILTQDGDKGESQDFEIIMKNFWKDKDLSMNVLKKLTYNITCIDKNHAKNKLNDYWVSSFRSFQFGNNDLLYKIFKNPKLDKVFSKYNLDLDKNLKNRKSVFFKSFELEFHNETIKQELMSHHNNFFKWRIIRNVLYGPNEFKIGLDPGKKIIKKIEILDIIRPFGLDLIQVEKELHNIYIYEHATITDVSIKNYLLNFLLLISFIILEDEKLIF